MTSERLLQLPPLESGDRLSRAEFERRYAAMPQLKKAELIEGVVYVASPLRYRSHGQPHLLLITWLGTYCAATPGVEAADAPTIRLDADNEPQPDAILRLAQGGKSTVSADDYIEGAPELVVEIAASSASYDLYDKLRVYRRNGVQEYIVWRTYDLQIDWFYLEEDEYRTLAADADGILRSQQFPGLWLAGSHLLANDLAAVLAVLQQGTATPEHQAFVTALQPPPPVIYLDYHATTPVDPRVADRVYHSMTQEFGNASSVDHEWGHRAETAIKQAAKQVADLIEASPREIVWTSGATESINLAIQGSLTPNPMKPHRIGLMPIEHKAVLDTCRALEKRGWAELIHLQVDSRGRLDLEHLEQVCAEGLSLLCVMAANNEIGTIYPIQKIGRIAQHYGIPFLCDGSQAVGKISVQFEEWGITYLAISAHKFYGPKGVGALAVRRGYHLEPLIFGGGHQRGMRSGTLNVPGIVGLGEACRLRSLEMEEDERAIASKRDRLQKMLLEKVPIFKQRFAPDKAWRSSQERFYREPGSTLIPRATADT